MPYIKDWKLEKIQDHTSEVDRSERKYLLHTYNKATYGEKNNRIWHIHGEARKVDSIVLGHYYYGSLLYKYKDLLDKRGNAYSKLSVNEDMKEKSWLDAFILSDVYVLGFGFNLSEFDLWWLLNRKKREKAAHGTVYYYSPKESGEELKIELLRTLGAKCSGIDFDFDEKDKTEECPDEDKKIFYSSFYEAAIDDIARRVHNELSAEQEENRGSF